MDNFDTGGYLPYPLNRIAEGCLRNYGDSVREFFITRQGCFCADVGGKRVCADRDGFICDNGGIKVSDDLFAECFMRICDYSVYGYTEMIREGFITLRGGHRVGICGTAVGDNGDIIAVKNISALNYRIARQFKGIAERAAEHIIHDGIIRNTVIASPPGCGKTTFLRDAARILSDRGYRVCIADSRSEIAACYKGKPMFDVGKNTAVFDGYSKSIGMENALRSFNPDVVVCDEIGSEDELNALRNLLYRGVGVIISVHCSERDLFKNAIIGQLFFYGGCDCLIILKKEPCPASISRVMLKGEP